MFHHRSLASFQGQSSFSIQLQQYVDDKEMVYVAGSLSPALEGSMTCFAFKLLRVERLPSTQKCYSAKNHRAQSLASARLQMKGTRNPCLMSNRCAKSTMCRSRHCLIQRNSSWKKLRDRPLHFCNSPYNTRWTPESANSEYHWVGLTDMRAFVRLLSAVIHSGAHGPMFCSELQFET